MRQPPQQFTEDSEGDWITIGGKQEGDKQHAGGFPVKLDKDGNIIAGGPKGLRGKHVSQVKDHFDAVRGGGKEEDQGRVKVKVKSASVDDTGRIVGEKDEEKDGYEIPGTEGVFALTEKENGWWYVIHTPTGTSMDFVKGKSAASSQVQQWWENLDDEDKETIKQNDRVGIGGVTRKYLRFKRELEKPTQFSEEAEGAEDALRPFLTPATAWIRKTIQELLDELRGVVGSDVARPTLFDDITAIIGRLRERMRRGLSESMVAAGLHGFHEISLEATEFVPPYTPGGTAIMDPPDEPPPIVTPTAPDDGDEPEIRFPTVERMLEDMRTSPVFSDADYREVAQQAQDGAFAVTGELEARTVESIREVLTENLERGPDPERFVEDVQKVLTSSDGLSEAHLNTVFRTNMSASLSKSMNDALNKPLVGDFFPYRSYYATTDRAVRPEHLAMETLGLSGTNIFNADDPVWRLFEPPWDYNCRCSWSATSIRQAARRGVQEAKDWLARARAMADEMGGEAADYYQETRPVFEFVKMPPFQPPAEFERR